MSCVLADIAALREQSQRHLKRQQAAMAGYRSTLEAARAAAEGASELHQQPPPDVSVTGIAADSKSGCPHHLSHTLIRKVSSTIVHESQARSGSRAVCDLYILRIQSCFGAELLSFRGGSGEGGAQLRAAASQQGLGSQVAAMAAGRRHTQNQRPGLPTWGL